MYKILTIFTLLIFSTLSIAADQLTWIEPELREDGETIEEIEKYILYHWYENILQPNIEIDGAAVVYSDTDRRIGLHVYEISTVEGGQEGRRSYPYSYYVQPNSKPLRVMLTLEQIP